MQSKVLILACGSVLALIAVLVLFSRFFLLHHFSEIDEHIVARHIDMTSGYLSDEASLLSSTAADWATRDDTYRFNVDNNSSTYVKTNTTYETMANLRLNLMAFIDASNRIQFVKAFDLNKIRETPLPQNLEKHLALVNSQLQGDKARAISGILLLEEFPAIVACAPILQSDGNGPVNGTLIFARYLDNELIKKIEQKYSFRMTLWPLDRQGFPDTEFEALSHLSSSSDKYVNAVNGALIAGYALLYGADNKPVLLLKVVLPRTFYNEGQNVVFYFMMGMVAICFIFGALMLLGLKKNVLVRLRQLSMGIQAIGDTGDHSIRLPVFGHDEIARVSASVNRMLISLKQSSNELESSKEFNENLVNKSPTSILVINPDTSIKYVNPAFEKLTGFSEEEVIGTKAPFPWWIESTEASKRFEINFTKELFKAERNFRAKSGKPFWVEATATNVTSKGTLEYRVVTLVDITERKNAEDMLRYSEERFRTFIDNSHDCIFVLDKDGNLIFVSPSVRRLGYEPQELLGKNAFSLLYPDDVEPITSRFAKRIIIGGDIEPVIMRAKSKDGRWLALEVAGRSLLDNPAVGGLLLTARDITERHEMERKLKACENFSFSVIENAPNPFILFNPDISIFHVNSAFEKLSGFTRDEVVGKKPPYPWWPSKDWGECTRCVQRVCAGIGPIAGERVFKNKKGEDFWIIGTAVGMTSEGEVKRTLCSWVDITEQKRLWAKGQFYMSETAKAQEEERKRVARDLHDETVQSLASVVMELDYLARDKKRIKKEDLIQRIHEQRNKTSEIVDSLRHFIHALRPSIIDQGLVPALELLVDELNQEGLMDVRFEVRGEERRLLPEKEIVLFRIAQEALRNVRKHSRATEAVVVLLFASSIRLTVADNGAGLEPSSVQDDLAGGIKLGLRGMRERALLIGGNLRIVSQPGKGTKIIVESAKCQDFLRKRSTSFKT